jgi:DNA helicase-2/ATP-dependent DNA helicase PcrA
VNIPYIPPRTEAFTETALGRWVLALARIVCDPNDYVAHRTLLGLRQGIGIKTCANIASAVTVNNLNFRDIFYHSLPAGVFSGRILTALNDVRTVLAAVSQWQPSDTIAMRATDIQATIQGSLPQQAAAEWNNFAGNLPQGMTIEELRAYLWADGEVDQERVLNSVRERLGDPVSPATDMADHVRIMTMHGAKGLSARAVFIPGLEEALLPGSKRSPYPGLVLEAARLLYVSMTRARLACFLSYASTRVVNGNFTQRIASRFCAQLGGTFTNRTSGLSATEVQALVQDLPHL